MNWQKNQMLTFLTKAMYNVFAMIKPLRVTFLRKDMVPMICLFVKNTSILNFQIS